MWSWGLQQFIHTNQFFIIDIYICPGLFHLLCLHHFLKIKHIWECKYINIFPSGWIVKNLSANAGDLQETKLWSQGWEDLLEKEMSTHFSILPWEIPFTEEPGIPLVMPCRCVIFCNNQHFNFKAEWEGFVLFFSQVGAVTECRKLGPKAPSKAFSIKDGTLYFGNQFSWTVCSQIPLNVSRYLNSTQKLGGRWLIRTSTSSHVVSQWISWLFLPDFHAEEFLSKNFKYSLGNLKKKKERERERSL